MASALVPGTSEGLRGAPDKPWWALALHSGRCFFCFDDFWVEACELCVRRVKRVSEARSGHLHSTRGCVCGDVAKRVRTLHLQGLIKCVCKMCM